MNKQKQNRSKFGKITKNKTLVILIMILLAPAIIGALLIVVVKSHDLIRGYLDGRKLDNLDSRIQVLYEDLVSVSNPDEKWSYETYCTDEEVGWMNTGKYMCYTNLMMTRYTTDASDVLDVHERYYEVVNQSDLFKTTKPISISSGFGERLVVGGAEEKYDDKKTKAMCTYITALDQTQDVSDTYGSKIVGNGQVRTQIRCYVLSYKSQYQYRY